MPRTTIPQKAKKRAELQMECGSVCPFCPSTAVGEFEIHHIDEDHSNNEMDNLILLCPTCHAKVTKCEISMADVRYRKLELKFKHLETMTKEKEEKSVRVKGNRNTTVVGNNNVTNIHQPTKTKIKKVYRPGSIGENVHMVGYVGHLIDRYKVFKKIECDQKGIKMNYAAFSAKLKKEFKVGVSNTYKDIPAERFEEVIAYIQKRIGGTMQGRINKSKGYKLFSTYEEYKNGS